MGCTKGNSTPSKGENKNVFAQMLDLWKNDVNWNEHTEKGKKICIAFSLCMAAQFLFGHTFFVIPALIGMILLLDYLKDLNVEE